nr:hypothetical protein [Tanacetum cinerariifolium]
MSLSHHPTITPSGSDMENAFSSMNILNYTPALSDTLRITSSNSLKDSRDGMIPLAFLPFYNNLYIKDVEAFYAKESPIPPPATITTLAVLTPSLVLPPSLLFDPRYFFVPKELLPSKKQTHLPSLSSIDLSNPF